MIKYKIIRVRGSTSKGEIEDKYGEVINFKKISPKMFELKILPKKFKAPKIKYLKMPRR